MTQETEIIPLPNKEYVKLIKNTKNVNWEIKFYGTGDGYTWTEADQQRLDAKQEELINKYGGTDENS